MQITRLREREPLESAVVRRAQNSLAGLREQRAHVVRHAVREHRHRTSVFAFVPLRTRGIRRKLRAGARSVMRTCVRWPLLLRRVQPPMQRGTYG